VAETSPRCDFLDRVQQPIWSVWEFQEFQDEITPGDRGTASLVSGSFDGYRRKCSIDCGLGEFQGIHDLKQAVRVLRCFRIGMAQRIA
jgi:hypothetical protein